jgi:hypothetical protein
MGQCGWVPRGNVLVIEEGRRKKWIINSAWPRALVLGEKSRRRWAHDDKPTATTMWVIIMMPARKLHSNQNLLDTTSSTQPTLLEFHLVPQLFLYESILLTHKILWKSFSFFFFFFFNKEFFQMYGHFIVNIFLWNKIRTRVKHFFHTDRIRWF